MMMFHHVAPRRMDSDGFGRIRTEEWMAQFNSRSFHSVVAHSVNQCASSFFFFASFLPSPSEESSSLRRVLVECEESFIHSQGRMIDTT